MNKKGLLTGVSLAASAASLAVASTALATQPEATGGQEINLMIPQENSQMDAAKIQGMIEDAAKQTKEEINEAKGKDIEDIKQTAEEAFEQATRATFELAEITDQMNTNIEIYNEDLRTISKQLEENKQLLQKLSEQINNHKEKAEDKWVNFETKNKEFEEFKKWRDGREAKDKDFGEKYEEIKKLYELLKEIKEVSDVQTAMEYVQKITKEYLDETQTMEDKLFMFKESIMDRLY